MFFGEFATDTFIVEIFNDAEVEDTESFQVMVMGVTPLRMSSRMEVTVSIIDNDIEGIVHY